jgi:flagellar FliL protein
MSDDDRDDLLEEAVDALRQGGDDDLGDDIESSGRKGGGKKTLLLILLPLLLLGGGGAGVYFSGILDNETKETAQADTSAKPIPQPRKSRYFDLPDMMVNLNSVGPRPSFLKLRASLEVDEETDTILLKMLRPRIIDKFQVYLRELRLNDLRANDGLSRLREELRVEINKAVSPVNVKQVLFRNILVQ